MTVTPIRKLIPGEPAHHPSVLNRPLEDVLSGSSYAIDGSDFAGFAKKDAQATTAAGLASEITNRVNGDTATLTSANAHSDGAIATETTARIAGDATTLASAATHADAGDITTLASAATDASTKANTAQSAAQAFATAAVGGEASARAAADALRLGVYVVQFGEVSVTSTQYPAGDVRRYGVTGDGVTDNTATFTAAKTSANALGIAMTVPSGTYLLDSTVLDVALRIICAPNVTFKLKDNASTLFGDTRCVFAITHSDVQILGTPTIDANRAGQSQSTFNAAGGSAALSWWGIKAVGTSSSVTLTGLDVRVRVINATDVGLGWQYVSLSRLDVQAESSGFGVRLADCVDLEIPRIVARSLDNIGAKVLPQVYSAYRCARLAHGSIVSTDHYGTGTVALGTSRDDLLSGVTWIDVHDSSYEVMDLATRESSLCASGVGFSQLNNSKIRGGLTKITGYSNVLWEQGAVVNSTFTNVDIDGRYQTNPAGVGSIGWYLGNSGFYSTLTTRTSRPCVGNRYANVRIRRCIGVGHAIYTAARNEFVNVSATACRNGLYINYQALDTADNFTGQPVKDIRGNRWTNCDYSYNELEGVLAKDGRDVKFVGVSANNNCQANNAPGGARLDGATTATGGGITTAASATGSPLQKSGWQLIGCDASDHQTWSDACSLVSTSPRAISVVDTSRYFEGQVVKLVGAGVAAADLLARVVSVDQDEVTLDRDVSTFPTVAGTGTISSSGTTLTGSGTAFTTELSARYFITAGGNTRQIVKTSSNTSATLASAFPSNLSGAAFTITKIVTQGVPSQRKGLDLAVSLLSPKIIGGSFENNLTADISDATTATTPAQYIGVFEVASANLAKGPALVQTTTGLGTPRLFFYNAADGIGFALYAASTQLNFTTGATPGSASGTTRMSLTSTLLALTAGVGIQIGAGTVIQKFLSATVVWDPASLAAGAQATTTVTVTGAVFGDTVVVGFSKDLQALQLTGYVSAADTITVVLRNGTAGAIDLASGTLRADIWQH